MKRITCQFSGFNFGIILFLLFSQLTFSQITPFSLNVTATNETCEDNGSISFTTTGTTPGASIIYAIYLLPNTTTAVGTTSGNTYSGLDSGTYRIIATQSLGTESNSQQQDVTVLNQVVQLEYSLIGASHLCDQKITVNVTQGIPVQYEIISGPVLKPLQTSNVFTGLTPGVYLIRVFDNCGDGIVQSYNLINAGGGGLQIGLINTITNSDCDTATFNQTLNNAGSEDFIYPITLHYMLTLPSGQQILMDQTLTNGNQSLINISQEIPFFPEQSFSFSLEVSDGCGNTFETTGNVMFPVSEPSVSEEVTGCNTIKITIRNASSATVIEAPNAYSHTIPHVLQSSGVNTFIIEDLPNGEYTFSLIDLCGVEHIKDLVIDTPEILPPLRTVLNGCEPGFGSVAIITQSDFANVKIVQAPAEAGFNLPYDVSFNIDSSSFNFYMNSLPQGTYIFKTLDICGNEYELTCPVSTYEQTATVNVMQNCGSFDLQVLSQGNVSNPMSYWLQKLNPISNVWEHPYTGAFYIENTALTNLNSVPITSNAIVYNITGYGHFRILGRYSIFGNAVSSENCFVFIEEFDFLAKPKINNVVSVSCQDGTYDVIVDASGVAPFDYKIITKNGSPFTIVNQNSSLFLGIEAAVYGFEVKDDCGNVLNADYEIGNSNGFPIEVNNLCIGQNVSLSTLSFPFLSYEWWKGNDAGTILSTSNTLNFATFNPVVDSGAYHVRVYYADNPASCIDFTSDIDVFLNENLPEAGVPSNPTYCGSPGSVDLFSLLSNYDQGGIWQEITNSGMLTGNNWNASTLQSGFYQFKYKVSDSCNNSDEATLNITIKSIPETPEISVDSVICTNKPLQLFASPISSGTYSWSGPNGFISNQQNPIIESPTSANDGIYTLKIILIGCESESVSTTLNVNDFPEFVIVGGCENNEDNYVLKSVPMENSYQESEVVYSWTGPEGYTANNNRISVTNQPIGVYSLTVTNGAGCSSSKDFEVTSTVCRIPKGISPNNDGDNDTFDLSGFDILNLKIYSRYGRLVYEKENYIDQWRGQDFKNRELPDATYFYFVQMKDGEERTGWVYKTH